jgi:hypothetical protein
MYTLTLIFKVLNYNTSFRRRIVMGASNQSGSSAIVVIVVVAIAVSLILASTGLISLFPDTTTTTTPPTPTTVGNQTIPIVPPLENLTEHAPISIIGDQEFANQVDLEEWPGNGTASDPFIIEGLRIVTDTRACILIQDVLEYHFIIRDCYLEAIDRSLGVCVKIYESANGVVENCRMVSGYQGMDFFGSTDCMIRDSVMWDVGCGINATFASSITIERNIAGECYWAMMLGLADAISMRNNYFTTSDIGVGAYESNNVTMALNSITDNRVGLETDYNCQSWTITQCLFFNNTQVGIDLKATTQFIKVYSNHFGMNMAHARDNGASNSWDDGVSVGNAWEDYSGIGTYSIPGIAGSVDHYPTLYEP